MRLTVIAAVFPLVFLGELPDKTMFASLVLASRGRPVAVWVGAAGAFVVHVVLAVAAGAALFALIPHRPLEAVVSAAFFAGAIYSFLIRNESADDLHLASSEVARQVTVRAAVVIFVAEWGDITQILIANSSARYHSPLSVGVASLAALWVVAAIAVAAGSSLLRILSVRSLRLTTSAVLLGLAAFTAVQAAR